MIELSVPTVPCDFNYATVQLGDGWWSNETYSAGIVLKIQIGDCEPKNRLEALKVVKRDAERGRCGKGKEQPSVRAFH